MQILKLILATVVLALSTSAYADSAVSVNTYYLTSGSISVPMISVEAEVNRVKIESVEVNRGNCETRVAPSTRKTDLVYGEEARFNVFPASCNIKEIVVNTDLGNFGFKKN
ncbi:hypothetical protein [Lonepinella sp. MS14437]|uniref:hypothetical protein n=1 Tax=Lonepinella sp. MS14437 TaxID=3003620 RepID=UPI0036DF40C0